MNGNNVDTDCCLFLQTRLSNTTLSICSEKFEQTFETMILSAQCVPFDLPALIIVPINYEATNANFT